MPNGDRLPYISMYVSDFLSHNKVDLMTTEQIGAYFLLILRAWKEEPPATIPDDDEVLANWVRLSVDRWKEIRDGVLACWRKDGDRWMQPRLKEEHEKAEVISRRRSRSGKKGAKARWKKEKGRNRSAMAGPCDCHSEAMARAFDSDSDSDSSGREERLGEGKGKRPARKLTRNQQLYEHAVSGASRALGRQYDRALDGKSTHTLIARQSRSLGPDEVRQRLDRAFTGDRRSYPVIEFLEKNHWTLKVLFSGNVLQQLVPSSRERSREERNEAFLHGDES